MANLKYLPQDKIRAMKQKFNTRVDKKLKTLITPDMSEQKIKTIRQYLTIHFLNAETRPDQSLKSLVERGNDFIHDVTKRQALPLFSPEQQLEIKEAARFRYQEIKTGLLDTSYRRLYFPLIPPTETSATQIKIEQFLSAKDYVLHDYKLGYAKRKNDDKQILKIGKIIKSDHQLLKAFQKDFTRFAHKQFLVLSSYTNDIAYMSTRRGWESCMSYDGDYVKNMPNDIKHGTLVAYLINEDDPHIYNPLARILFKALYNKNGNGNAVYIPAKSYGLYHSAFQETANQISQQLSTDEYGSFKLIDGVYQDNCITNILKLPNDLHDMKTEQVLDLLCQNYTKEDDGSFTVHGNLSLCGFSLKSLPDLKNVKIEGNFDCSANELTSLSGCPEYVEGHFICSGNNLTNLIGAPKHVGKTFVCQNCNLTSLIGAPEQIDSSFFCSSNRLKNLNHAPKRVNVSFFCDFNDLNSLSGAPEFVGGVFNCSNNLLLTLDNAPKTVIDSFKCTDNFLNTLEGIPQNINDLIFCWNNPLKTLEHAPKHFSQLLSDIGNFSSYEDIIKSFEKIETPQNKSHGMILKP